MVLKRLRKPAPPSSSSSSYLYRREVRYEPDPDYAPSLTITPKLQTKENLIFGGAPNFNELKNDDRRSKTKMGSLSLEELKEIAQKEKEEQERIKKNKKKAPSVEEVRRYLKSISSYHKHEVEKELPSAYPVLGPAGEKSDDDENGGTKNEKGTTRDSDKYNRSYKEKSGRKNELTNVFQRKGKTKRGKK